MSRLVAEANLASTLRGSDVVINAAGVTGNVQPREILDGANALLPMLLAETSRRAGVRRFIHVSSAAVQGRRTLDDQAWFAPTNPYSSSKALGELLLSRVDQERLHICCYRPTSVQGPNRPVTQRLRELAHSRLAAVAAPGVDPTPQIHVDNVGIACAHLAREATDAPFVVLHPWEGWTTRTFLQSLGDRDPQLVPRPIASAVVKTAKAVAKPTRALDAQVRRLEMLMYGQRQRARWLDTEPLPWIRRFADWNGHGDPGSSLD